MKCTNPVTPRATATYIRKLADRISKGTAKLCAIESRPATRVAYTVLEITVLVPNGKRRA